MSGNATLLHCYIASASATLLAICYIATLLRLTVRAGHVGGGGGGTAGSQLSVATKLKFCLAASRVNLSRPATVVFGLAWYCSEWQSFG